MIAAIAALTMAVGLMLATLLSIRADRHSGQERARVRGFRR